MHLGGHCPGTSTTTVMGLAEPEDCIAKQGTDGLRLWIDLTNIVNDYSMKVATLDHAVQEPRTL